MLVRRTKKGKHSYNGRAAAPPEPIRLDLGCGQNRRDGFVGVDIVKTACTDVVFDLRQTPWPWKDESVGEMFSNHFFEHLSGPERIGFMNELWRVLVPGGKARIITPYYSSVRASQDPTHAWPPISEYSYLYFNADWRKANKLDHYPITADFDFAYGYVLRPDVAARNLETQQYMAANNLNAVLDIDVTLTKKPGASEK